MSFILINDRHSDINNVVAFDKAKIFCRSRYDMHICSSIIRQRLSIYTLLMRIPYRNIRCDTLSLEINSLYIDPDYLFD